MVQGTVYYYTVTVYYCFPNHQIQMFQ